MPLQAAKKLLRLDEAVGSFAVQHDITKVLDGLYVGGRGIADDLLAMQSLAITHVVNCTQDIPCYYDDSLEYLRVPLTDDPDTAIEAHFEIVVKFIRMYNDAREMGQTCLVHCSRGMSRSATFVLVYLVERHDMSVLEALQYTRALRPVISPNVGFMGKLLDLEQRLHQRCSVDLHKYRKDRYAAIEDLVVPSPANDVDEAAIYLNHVARH
ncbi:hypothetical protein DYB37_007009 [Aphanomyces astaci]|uniref:Dual specificity protein phosphatase n=1 Tax=Aphanomyces astaci TaxID=112090 RepID=A0A418EUJ8_APHAT|nr:hypothetical protein DYB35_005156 [Aphanomyces astaci]RHZ19200.1 hypothetical protein DYB37_007009 [Aphanomyces astaci]